MYTKAPTYSCTELESDLARPKLAHCRTATRSSPNFVASRRDGRAALMLADSMCLIDPSMQAATVPTPHSRVCDCSRPREVILPVSDTSGVAQTELTAMRCAEPDCRTVKCRQARCAVLGYEVFLSWLVAFRSDHRFSDRNYFWSRAVSRAFTRHLGRWRGCGKQCGRIAETILSTGTMTSFNKSHELPCYLVRGSQTTSSVILLACNPASRMSAMAARNLSARMGARRPSVGCWNATARRKNSVAALDCTAAVAEKTRYWK